jgi:hypothetical protein
VWLDEMILSVSIIIRGHPCLKCYDL